MVKRCIAAGCSNSYSDGVSLFSFPRDPSLRARWNKQVQRTRADWRDATDYSVICSDHFTNDCFEKGSIMASQFGIQKRRRLKPDAVPTIFNRPARGPSTTASRENLQEGPSMVGHKRSAVTHDESIPVEKKTAFEKRERARVSSMSYSICILRHNSFSYIASPSSYVYS